MEEEEGELGMIPVFIALWAIPILFGGDDEAGEPTISDKYAALYRVDDKYDVVTEMVLDRMGGGGGGGGDKEYWRRRYY